MLDPLLAPRRSTCKVCILVADPGAVTELLYDAALDHTPPRPALEYLRSVGIAVTERNLRAMVAGHRRHVDKFLDRGGNVAPAQFVDGISRIDPKRTSWVELNQQGMNAGASALDILKDRLQHMEDKDLISVARMGQAAASTRASLEMKGAMKRAEEIARLAAGLGTE